METQKNVEEKIKSIMSSKEKSSDLLGKKDEAATTNEFLST